METQAYKKKKIEITGSSTVSIEDAVQNAIRKASQSIHNMIWFEVADTRGYIQQNGVSYWQVTLKVGFSSEAG